jgi:hypothetical protein
MRRAGLHFVAGLLEAVAHRDRPGHARGIQHPRHGGLRARQYHCPAPAADHPAHPCQDQRNPPVDRRYSRQVNHQTARAFRRPQVQEQAEPLAIADVAPSLQCHHETRATVVFLRAGRDAARARATRQVRYAVERGISHPAPLPPCPGLQSLNSRYIVLRFNLGFTLRMIGGQLRGSLQRRLRKHPPARGAKHIVLRLIGPGRRCPADGSDAGVIPPVKDGAGPGRGRCPGLVTVMPTGVTELPGLAARGLPEGAGEWPSRPRRGCSAMPSA